jgi:hypothetical protein
MIRARLVSRSDPPGTSLPQRTRETMLPSCASALFAKSRPGFDANHGIRDRDRMLSTGANEARTQMVTAFLGPTRHACCFPSEPLTLYTVCHVMLAVYKPAPLFLVGESDRFGGRTGHGRLASRASCRRSSL